MDIRYMKIYSHQARIDRISNLYHLINYEIFDFLIVYNFILTCLLFYFGNIVIFVIVESKQ